MCVLYNYVSICTRRLLRNGSRYKNEQDQEPWLSCPSTDGRGSIVAKVLTIGNCHSYMIACRFPGPIQHQQDLPKWRSAIGMCRLRTGQSINRQAAFAYLPGFLSALDGPAPELTLPNLVFQLRGQTCLPAMLLGNLPVCSAAASCSAFLQDVCLSRLRLEPRGSFCSDRRVRRRQRWQSLLRATLQITYLL